MSASPSYGERPPLQGAFRRSFTTPTRQLSIHEKAGLEKADADADILYSQSPVRIVSFSPPKESIKSTSKAEIPADTDYPVDTVETLPWRSRTETLSANGTMVIEKVRGSTNFLKCQGVTHAILRNSQCWCVDGESKFVLRVRKFQYYRIELPSTTEQDKAKVEELKKVFSTVLRYERTPCPFVRAFSVDLPDDAITPRRKGQWKRRDSSQPNTPETETPQLQRIGPNRSWSMRNPPSSYPKHGPSSSLENFEGERGRTASPYSVHRRASLFEDRRNDSPSSFAPSDEGTDSERQPSEHESEPDATPERSETDSPVNLPDKESTRPPSDSLRISKRSLRDVSTESEALSGLESGQNETLAQPKSRTSKSDVSLGSSGLQTADKHEIETSSTEELVIPTGTSSVADGNTSTTKDSVLNDSEVKHEESMDHAAPDKLQSEQLRTNAADDETVPDLATAPTISRLSLQTTAVAIDGLQKPTSEDAVTGARLKEDDNVTRAQATDRSSIDLSSNSDSPSEPRKSQPNIDLKEDDLIPVQVDHPIVSVIDKQQPTMSMEISSSSSAVSESVTDSSEDEQEEDGIDLKHETGSVEASSELEEDSSLVEKDRQTLEERITSDESDEHSDEDEVEDRDVEDDSRSTTSSVDSFHTLASPFDDSSMNNRFDLSRISNVGIEQQGSNTFAHHKREWSELTVTASSASDFMSPTQDVVQQSNDQPKAPSPVRSSIADRSLPETIPASYASTGQEGLRQRQNAQRSFSPLPPASTIFTGNQIRHGTGSGHMTKVILQKVIVKPLEVAIMVVHILARIAGGATVSDLLSGELFKRPEHYRRPSTSSNQLQHGKGTSDTEDDYGVPIRGRKRSSERSTAKATDTETRDVSADVD